MSTIPDKATYRVGEVAAFFDVTPRTVYGWIKRGQLEVVRTPGGRLRIPREAMTSRDALLQRAQAAASGEDLPSTAIPMPLSPRSCPEARQDGQPSPRSSPPPPEIPPSSYPA
jgi:excisionase family DNA binding protein